MIIAADREKVWRALTQPEHFSKWFGGEILFARLAVGESMTFNVGGESGPATIAIVEPPERFAFSWTVEPSNPTRTLVTFHLEAVGAGTSLTVTEQGFEALPEHVRQKRFELNNEGWGIQVENIAAYVRNTSDV